MIFSKKYLTATVSLLCVIVCLVGCHVNPTPSIMTYEDFKEEISHIPSMLDTDEEVLPREDKYFELLEEEKIDLKPLIDNDTPLSELVENQKISQENAWHASYVKFDGEGGTSSGIVRRHRIFEAYLDIQPFQFVRDTGLEFMHHRKGGTYKRLYTVYKADEGGYVYLFFDYRLHDGLTKAKRAVYVAEPHCYRDFKNLKVGDSIYDVAAIDPIALNSVNNKVESCHLLSDGVLVIQYEEEKIKSIYYNEDYLAPNTMDFAYDAENPDFMNEEAYRYNLYILPQDYPQN